MRLTDAVREAVRSAIKRDFNASDLAILTMRLSAALSQWNGSTKSPRDIVERALTADFKKAVKAERLEKSHKGISHFTLTHLTPKARDLLHQSILKNVDLIVLSKQSAEALTLRRFSSWYVSADTSKRADSIAANILKPIYNTDYENRRLLNDQGHKLIAAVNNAIATDAGAIAMKWHQNWTANPRNKGTSHQTNHKQFDNKVYVIRTNNPWVEKGVLHKGTREYLEDLGTMPAHEINCVCSGTYYYSLHALYRDYPEAFTAKGKAMIQGKK